MEQCLKSADLFFIVAIFFAITISCIPVEDSNKLRDTLLRPADRHKPMDCECGKITRKIEDERLAKVKIPGGRVPWLAELITQSLGDSRNNDEYRLCFGTVVSMSSVLFPASCIDSTSHMKPKVKLLGVPEKNNYILNISSVRIHPKYRNKYDNDIALVTLSDMISFNETGIVPACLSQPKTSKMFDILQLNNEEDVLDELIEYDWDWKDEEETEEGDEAIKKQLCPSHPCSLYKLETNVVIRTWFKRKAPGYPDVQHFGRFSIHQTNSSWCHSTFPEMLKSKVNCIQQREIKAIMKQNDRFFKQLELGMPMMNEVTLFVKKKPKQKSIKYYLTGMRSPGHGGVPLLPIRQNIISLLKLEDYVPWIRENSHGGHFCKS